VTTLDSNLPFACPRCAASSKISARRRPFAGNRKLANLLVWLAARKRRHRWGNILSLEGEQLAANHDANWLRLHKLEVLHAHHLGLLSSHRRAFLPIVWNISCSVDIWPLGPFYLISFLILELFAHKWGATAAGFARASERKRT
jgi:hypothetical protein